MIFNEIFCKIDNLTCDLLKNKYIKKKKKGFYAKIDINFYMNWCECLKSYSTQNVWNCLC